MDLAEESTPLYSIRNHFFAVNLLITPHTEIFNDLLKLAVDSDVSDIVIKTNKLGYVRFAGQLKPVDMDSLLGEDIRAFVEEHVPKVFRPLWNETYQVDFAYAAEGVGRFRVNAFHQRGTPSIVFKHIKSTVPEFEDLGLNGDAMLHLAKAKDGILLICGATGSGKSSTMAALLNWINRNLDRHIVTIEHPIEYTFEDDKSVSSSVKSAPMCRASNWPSRRFCVRILISSSSVKCGTKKPLRPRFRRWKPVTWCSPPCTRQPLLNPSRVCSNSSRPSNLLKLVVKSRVRCAALFVKNSSRRSKAMGESPPMKFLRLILR